MRQMLVDATYLNLINKIDDKTGASVAMWRDVDVAPLGWGQYPFVWGKGM